MPRKKVAVATAPDREASAGAMLARLRESGLKLTPQRMAIVRELCADPTHPTAQELYERLRPALPSMSFATVYNTLDALAAAGLCGALSLSPGAARFDPNMFPHHHAVCDRCGMVRDVPRHDGEGALAGRATPGALQHRVLPSEARDFQVRAVEWIYRGVCAECTRSERAVAAH